MDAQLTTIGGLLSPHNIATTKDLAVTLSKSSLLPGHFAGKPENILVVLSLAESLNINPMMALQQISVIGGKPCLQSTLMLSLLNQQKKLRGPLRFRFEGEPASPSRRCTAYGVDAATGEDMESIPVSLAMAQAEGWTRNNKYKTIPDVMLQWRAASFFVRAYYPEVVLGLHTAEEMEDVNIVRDTTPATNGGKSARERLAELREKERDTTPAVEAEVIEPATFEPSAEPTAETVDNEDMELLTDFLAGVADMTESGELDQAVEQSQSFTTPQTMRAAKEAIMARAKALGLVWSKESNCFVG